MKLSALGAAAGISDNTAKAWLSVVEASYSCIARLLCMPTPIKRLVKTPSCIPLDSGLLC